PGPKAARGRPRVRPPRGTHLRPGLALRPQRVEGALRTRAGGLPEERPDGRDRCREPPAGRVRREPEPEREPEQGLAVAKQAREDDEEPVSVERRRGHHGRDPEPGEAAIAS